MNNEVFGKTMENVRKQKFLTCNNSKWKKLFSIKTKLSYYQVFHRKFISNWNEETQIIMNKPVYLGLSILDLSKTIMYKFWYGYAGILKGEGCESRRFMLAFSCIFFWNRLSLMFHSSYQNGGKILSIKKPLREKMTQELIVRFLKTNYWVN